MSTSKIVIGIDVSKNWLDISINQEVTRINQEKSKITSFIKNKLNDPAGSLCVLESTGGYEKLAANCFSDAGVQVHIAHPNRVRHFAIAKGCLAKTDKLDAKMIESYGQFIEQDEIRALPNQLQQELNDLNSRLAQLKDTHHQESCRLHLVTCKFIKKSHGDILKILAKEIVKVETRIKKIISENAELKQKFKLLKTMKGVGDVLALTLITALPELGKVSKKEIAALVGVAPITKQSGQKKGKAMTQKGRNAVRRVLYMGALVAAHHNPIFKPFYNSLIERGKPKKVALVAVMRKMIVVLNAMITKNMAFNA